MASGTPVVVSWIPPFTEFLGQESCVWVDPTDPASIADGLAFATQSGNAGRLRAAGLVLAQKFSWDKSASTHLSRYLDEKVHLLEK
jgi:glycosyltransferase involved in cell wall biosynthesis